VLLLMVYCSCLYNVALAMTEKGVSEV
jgi:hypothetical protein